MSIWEAEAEAEAEENIAAILEIQNMWGVEILPENDALIIALPKGEVFPPGSVERVMVQSITKGLDYEGTQEKNIITLCKEGRSGASILESFADIFRLPLAPGGDKKAAPYRQRIAALQTNAVDKLPYSDLFEPFPGPHPWPLPISGYSANKYHNFQGPLMKSLTTAKRKIAKFLNVRADQLRIVPEGTELKIVQKEKFPLQIMKAFLEASRRYGLDYDGTQDRNVLTIRGRHNEDALSIFGSYADGKMPKQLSKTEETPTTLLPVTNGAAHTNGHQGIVIPPTEASVTLTP